MAISKRNRDKAMRIICDFNVNRDRKAFITTESLYGLGFPKDVDAKQTVDVLEAMGYVTYFDLFQRGSKFIELTDEGKCYFERKADRSREKRIEWIRYIITTLIALAAFIKSFFFPT